MILETIRIVADALADADTGVNAELDALSIDSGDTRPPQVAAVLDETRNAVREALDWPILTVSLLAEAVADGEVGTVFRDATIPVLVSYVTVDADADQVHQDTLYTLRAMAKVIRNLLKNANIAQRERNGVAVGLCQQMSFGPVEDEGEEGYRVTGALVCQFRVRDKEP